MASIVTVIIVKADGLTRTAGLVMSGVEMKGVGWVDGGMKDRGGLPRRSIVFLSIQGIFESTLGKLPDLD